MESQILIFKKSLKTIMDDVAYAHGSRHPNTEPCYYS